MTKTLYQPLNAANKEIRLLVLKPALSKSTPVKCDLEYTPLSAPPSYEALSYAWGKEEPVHHIILNGESFAIRENLASALKCLRKAMTSRTLWIDALCINQEDPDERSQQVILMRQVYERAIRVIIWLGEAGEGGRGSMKRLRTKLTSLSASYHLWNANRRHGHVKPQDFGNSVAWQETSTAQEELAMGQISQLLEHPWWRRVWVVQEATVAKKAILMCGQDVASWESVGMCIKWLRLLRGGDTWESYPFPDAEYNILNELRVRWRSAAWSASIYEFLYNFRRFDCTNPQDRIYAFIGLATDTRDLGIIPNYHSPPERVFQDFARTVISAHQNLLMLNCKREYHESHETSCHSKVHSLFDRARFFDIGASVSDGPGYKSRKGWVRLPQGWERRQDGAKVTFYDHNTQTSHPASPIPHDTVTPAESVAWQRDLPKGWGKTWDNRGRVEFKYLLNDDISLHPSNRNRFQLPSWVPNWAVWSVRDPEPLNMLTDPKPKYWASGLSSLPEFAPHSDLNILAIRGVLFDEIESVTPAWYLGDSLPPFSRKGVTVLELWEELALAVRDVCPYLLNGGRFNAFWRTHIADFAGEHAAPDEDQNYFKVWLRGNEWDISAPTERVLGGIWDTARLMSKLKSRGSDIIEPYFKLVPPEVEGKSTWSIIRDSVKNPPKIKRAYMALMQRIYRAASGRAMFVTRQGYLGLAPWNARVGDKVCILYGGNTPFLLRKEQQAKHFTLVGESYVYGIMGGEALTVTARNRDEMIFDIM